MNSNKNLAGKILTYTVAIFLFVIGIDKVAQLDFISNWQTLVGPFTHFLLPLSAGSIVTVEGVTEILLGILLLTPWKRISLVILVVTILIVIGDLFFLHYYNLARREIILVSVCFVMYLLDERTAERGVVALSTASQGLVHK